MKNPNAQNSNEAPYEPPTDSLLSVRTLGILLAGVVIGLVVGALVYAAAQPVPAAVVTGIGSAGAAIAGLHRVVEHSQRRRYRTACAHIPAAPPVGPPINDGAQRFGHTAAELRRHLEETNVDDAEVGE